MNENHSTLSLAALKKALSDDLALETETTPMPGDNPDRDALLKTLRMEAVRPTSTTSRNACLVHIYPTTPAMGTRYALGEFPLVLGRDSECGLCISDYSVSRRHARIHPRSDGYYAEDLGSTNGTYVNDVAAVMTRLKDGDYLRVGSCIYRFLMGGNVEADYHAVIYQLTIVDPLTDIHNQRFMLEFLERELVRSSRYQRPLSLVLFDVDHFKAVNDTLGHLGGDHVLHELAARIKPLIRSDELFARYGGEEFAVVLPEATREAAATVAERLRQSISDKPFHYDDVTVPVTISVGTATTIGEAHVTPGDLIARADERLYEAKRLGRNRVAI